MAREEQPEQEGENSASDAGAKREQEKAAAKLRREIDDWEKAQQKQADQTNAEKTVQSLPEDEIIAAEQRAQRVAADAKQMREEAQKRVAKADKIRELKEEMEKLDSPEGFDELLGEQGTDE